MIYKIYNCGYFDSHLIRFSNYQIEVKFYPLKYWVLAADIGTTTNIIYLHLPTLCVYIKRNYE